MQFETFLQERLGNGGFTTEDTLASFLPLMRQVAQAHEQEQIAPLAGVEALHVAGIQIWFEELRLSEPKFNRAQVRKVESAVQGHFEVIEESRVTTNVDDGEEVVHSLRIGSRDEEPTQPVYLPGYVAWEHLLDHHDPLTDVFSLGLILASLACGLDFNEEEDLSRFVARRRNLFELNSSLHPVLARAVMRMTDLNRHRRPQDLSTLLRALENYRDQDVDFELELAGALDFHQQDRTSKQQVIFSKLQERLFEISRRNRLLHFRATMQNVNLTQASVPLSFDVRSIRPAQVMTWDAQLEKAVAASKPISLNKYLNFNEALYLPGVLDKIRVEARRDQNEYGFAQLRLVACFLRWANLKESPPELYESPLVLIPVELVKKKGVRDTYWLTPLETAAEVNPVVRHLFKQLFDIDLPETIDLEASSLDKFYAYLVEKVESSDAGVSLTKIDRPRIDVIHEKARRRLDQYRRRAKLSGRGVRSFLDIDYSYDPANYHPLGLTLFEKRIRPAETRLQAIVGSQPRARRFAVTPEPEESATPAAEQPPEQPAATPPPLPADKPAKTPAVPTASKPTSKPATPPPAAEKKSPPVEPPVVEKEASLYAMRGHNDGNPYNWEFDLCNVTLGNFKYRKMSLVRDYAALQSENPPNPAFDATFSLSPRPVDHEDTTALPLTERFHVVPSDPTQTAAVAQSRTGVSYIIQGPPGTGKSQTITNLIADYVAQGKRVLFVCEKRAAIDVVFHRLRQKKLDALCCLIHDSQADKKSFVMDLKATYEAFLNDGDAINGESEHAREQILEKLHKELRPLEAFHAVMNASPADVGIPLRTLLERLIMLRTQTNGEGNENTSTNEAETADLTLPKYATFHQHAKGLQQFAEGLETVQADGVLARHPLCHLAFSVADHDQPITFVAEAVKRAKRLLEELLPAVQKSALPREYWCSMTRLAELFDFAGAAEFLAAHNLMSVQDKNSPQAKELQKQARQMSRLSNVLQAKQEAAQHWLVKLPADEVQTALDLAKAYAADPLRLFKPGWWRLRGVLKRCYDFSAHQVRPSWTRVLTLLAEEHQAAEAKQQQETEVCSSHGIKSSWSDFVDQRMRLQLKIDELPKSMHDMQSELLKSGNADQKILDLANAKATFQEFTGELETFLTGFEESSLDDLAVWMTAIDKALDELPEFLLCLSELADLPEELSSILRDTDWTVAEFEAAIARNTFDGELRSSKELQRFDSGRRDRQVRKLDRLTEKWQDANARLVCDRVRERFVNHVKVASLPAGQLTAEQKELKKPYNHGRRELEHEFGKSMRYKPIRDLVAGDSGMVVRDLKPVWLMSPLSVSDTLPLDTNHFDVVIFDEASQIPLEEAVPSLYRATQAIVVGDEMQLPPTNFFSARQTEDGGQLAFEEDGELVEYDLEGNSFLNHAARNLSSCMLGWHYRSRSESLISFSNWAFYHGRLLTVPEESRIVPGSRELLATSTDDATANAEELLGRAVTFHVMQHAVYEKRRNTAEAEYIAALVREMLNAPSRPTIGVVAFSEAQQDEIEQALQRLAREDRKFREQLDAEFEREEDDQFVGLLVKNLENIQGDERDVIIMSVCYGRNAEGKMRMNFGPINQSGGEKRLNVAFSRAKHHMALVSSIRSTDITNDYNDGANCLKNYLLYAEASSVGDLPKAQRVLQSMTLERTGHQTAEEEHSAAAIQIAETLRQRGYIVDYSVGQSHFRCDLAVRNDVDGDYDLGILIDNDAYYRQSDLLERDLMRPKLLQAFGWQVAVVLMKDWWEKPNEITDGLVKRLDEAQRAAPVSDDAEAAGDEADGVSDQDGEEELSAE